MSSFEASRRSPLPRAEILGPADPRAQARVTLYLRRREPLPPAGGELLTLEQLRERHGADPAQLEAVRTELERLGLRVVHADAGSRRVRVEGSVARLSEVFGVELHSARRAAASSSAAGDAGEFRYRTGELTLPEPIREATVAVLGLDTRPQARAHFRLRRAERPGSVSYTPLQVGAAYRFPEDFDGTGQGIALIELGGGYDDSTLSQYFESLGVAAPRVTAVPVDGGANAPTGDPDGPDGEVQLDIEVAGALAPGAALTVYFAANTDQGFADAVTDAAHATPTPTAISISWGSSEDAWTAQARQVLDAACQDAAALGITVLAAAGDGGSTDGGTDGEAHCDFPASSPHVLACGGTRLTVDSSGAIAEEVVWNDGTAGGATGGGVSDLYPLPSWQSAVGVPQNANSGAAGRGVPDVAGNADPASGYQVLVDGSSAVVGGTSAVAPLWAALVARLAQQAGRPLGLLQPVLYGGARGGRGPGRFPGRHLGEQRGVHRPVRLGRVHRARHPDGAALPTVIAGGGAGADTIVVSPDETLTPVTPLTSPRANPLTA